MNFRKGKNITMYNVYVDEQYMSGSVLYSEAEDMADQMEAVYPEAEVVIREEEDYIDED